MRFEKGKSGNPSGRPKRTEEEWNLVNACKLKSSQALDVILHVMECGESEKNRLSAAQFVIERAWGKAEATLKTELDGELVIQILKFDANSAAQ